MYDGNADLQPLPVERAAGLQQLADENGITEIIESDAAALHLEKRGLLTGHRGTVSEGVIQAHILRDKQP